jgi:tryptophanyl-tRNA synthetase
MNKPRILTGITTSGTPHLGNYVGAIRPAVEASLRDGCDSFFFLADYHALIKCHDPDRVNKSTLEIAAAWLALGLNPDRVTFYRQSDIPEIPELAWLLTCMTSKGLVNRAHAYKGAVQINDENGDDADFGVTMGLFSYPILMAADILMFNAGTIPVGRDQVQHIEMARDIAQRFNHHFGQHFVLPKAQIDNDTETLQGLDGRKMSKSYGNTIPLFLQEKQLKKYINKIKTNLLEPGQEKNPDDSAVFQIWKAFATSDQIIQMRQDFSDGIAWGEAKKQLFELLNLKFQEPREKYIKLIENPREVEEVLQQGAEKARRHSKSIMVGLRHAVGIRSLG